jgi:hypothetical protein
MTNPWLHLSERSGSPRYVLPDDELHVEAFNAEHDANFELDLDLIPAPFMGTRTRSLSCWSEPKHARRRP